MISNSTYNSFHARHMGPSQKDYQHMLSVLGEQSLETFMRSVIPRQLCKEIALDTPKALTEHEALAKIMHIIQKNTVLRSCIGQGYHDCIVPPVIARNVFENPGWYTAYTSYQAEISQGRLEALFNFQTLVSELTGLPIANASLLDEPTAVAEAVFMAIRYFHEKKNKIAVAQGMHPQTMLVLQTRAMPFAITIDEWDHAAPSSLEGYAALIVQIPDTKGEIINIASLAQKAHDANALLILAADPLMLTLLGTPQEWGADIVVGSMQRFGVPMGYGGPHAAYLATIDALKRQTPGRLVGQSVDTAGNPAYRLALQTREQHIKREKATSNICTSQVLLAVMSSMYAVYHGPHGLRNIAYQVHGYAMRLHKALTDKGLSVYGSQFFDTITWHVDNGDGYIIKKAMEQAGYNIRVIDRNTVSLAFDECITENDFNTLCAVLEIKNEHRGIYITDHIKQAATHIKSNDIVRNTPLLLQAVFNQYHTETEMMRYLRRLMDKDLALDKTMIPLGSCTMKLNAAAAMMPLSFPEIASLHPFAPLEQARGYYELITQLEQWLCEITGYDAVSVQPNAGSQGEYAGLLAIRAYHKSRGDDHRTVCLIPSSAHGTNPASAHMAGMDVVVVQCDQEGNIDVDDLTQKAETHSKALSVLMITYPSTHGVYETYVKTICDIVHAHGGQVYVDGANLNALVGWIKLTDIGADASHLNLHKTFAIPHGGGGPGVGPIGVKKHLVPFLPGNILLDACPSGNGPVSGAPWGSASILVISWMYIHMLGADGLKQATSTAVLNANYMAKRLSAHYTLLYTGENGMVAHECIFDMREFKQSVGISVDDIAKRLIDYGFHAPTMAWPVAGTFMIEPTESESLYEIDRFCEAMIAIRNEIKEIEQGVWPRDNNPLVHAPHTASVVTVDNWDRPYTRQEGVFPIASVNVSNKFWPPVSRVDNTYGDRNLVCSCLPPDAYDPKGMDGKRNDHAESL